MPGEFPISERLYAALLYLYPKQFRAAYDQQMRQTFRDACRAAYRQNGVGGLLALWLPTLLDLFKSALEQWAQRGEITMSKERLIAWASPLTVLVGLLWMVASIGDFVFLTRLASDGTMWDMFGVYPSLLSFLLMIPAFIGTRLRYKDAVGGFGGLGLVLSVAGCVGMIVFFLSSILLDFIAPTLDDAMWPYYVMWAFILSIMIGHALFGIDALRHKLLPRWNAMPLLVALPTLLLIVPTVIIATTLPRNYPLVFASAFFRSAVTGACWVLMGMAMADVRQRHEPAA